jgi:hypothetical protein
MMSSEGFLEIDVIVIARRALFPTTLAPRASAVSNLPSVLEIASG